MEKPNMNLRYYAKGNGVPLWRIAKEYGIHEMTLIGRLRKPFDKQMSAEFKKIVDKIAKEG